MEDLRNELRGYLVKAKPLNRESTMADPNGVAEYAAKRVSYYGYGNSQLLAQASRVVNAQQCAKILAECLAALPKPAEHPEPEPDLLTVEQAAAKLGNVSPRTVSREIDDGNLRCIRVRGTVRVPVDAIKDYIDCQQQQGESLFG